MLDRIAQSTTNHPWIVIALFVLITLFFGLQIPKAEVEPDMKKELPADLPARQSLDSIESLFGNTDLLMITVSADDVLSPPVLEQTKQITEQLELTKEIEKVISLFTLKDIKGEAGMISVEPAAPTIPKDTAAREALRSSIRNNDTVFKKVVSDDFAHTAIIAFPTLGTRDETLIEKVRAVLDAAGGPGEVHISGAPVLRNTQSRDIRSDMRRFMPIGLLVILIFLFICFRQLRGVLLPFAVTVAAIAVAIGLIPLVGWQIKVVTVILPVLLIAVANDYGIHIIARFQEDGARDRNADASQLAQKGIRQLAKPVLVTGITTIAGLLCLLVHVLVSAKQMGVLAAAGVGFALLASLFFIPAVLTVLPLPKPRKKGAQGVDSKASLLIRMLRAVAMGVTRRPGLTIIATAAVTAMIAAGIPLVRVDTNSVNYYPADSEVVRTANLVNDKFGGLFSISAIAEGDIKSPETMRAIDAFSTYLKAHPNVDITTSIAEVIRDMNEVIHDGDATYDTIPETRDAIAQYFLVYSASGDPEDFDRLVDFPYAHANLSARINENSTGAIKSVVDYANAYVDAHPNGPFKRVGGIGAVFAEMVSHVVHGQALSLVLSMLVVALLVGLLFRSPAAGILSAIPLGLAMCLLFGLMGYLGVELNVATAMLSSIMIGVGVDYTIHLLWRYRQERQTGVVPVVAVERTLSSTGRGIVFNALSVIFGFSVLMISSFLPVRFFGFLVVVSIAACLLGTLVLLPPILVVLKPKFAEPKTQTDNGRFSRRAVAVQ